MAEKAPPRSADLLVSMVLETPGVLDQLKTNPEETLKKLAIQATKELPTPALIVDRWIYRIVVIALGAVAIIAILGAVLLAFHGVGEKVIQVPDVVEATTLSRRCLLDRFHRVLGRSIHEEITRVRIDKISRLLLETNQSIAQIAVKLGYTGDDHLARYFKKETGMTPLAFRKQFISK